MQRKLFIFGLVVLLLVGSVPYFVGLYSREAIEDDIEYLQEAFKHDKLFTIELVSHKLGWMTSTAQVRLGVTAEFMQRLIEETGMAQELHGKGYSIVMEETLYHGPFIRRDGKWVLGAYASDARLSLNNAARQTLKDLIGHEDLFTLHSFVHINGAVDWLLKSEPFDLPEDAKEGRTTWEGAKAQLIVDSKNHVIDIDWQMPGMHAKMPNSLLKFDSLVYKSNLQRALYDLWVGRGDMTLKSLAVQDSDSQSSINVEGISFSGHSSFRDFLLYSRSSLRLEKLSFEDFQLSPFLFQFSVDNIHVGPLLEFSEKYDGFDPNNPPMQMMEDIQAILPQILKHRPTFSIDNITVRSTDGDFSGSFDIHFGYPENKDYFDPMLALGYLKSNLILRYSENLIDNGLIEFWQEVNATQPHAQELLASEREQHIKKFIRLGKLFLLREKVIMPQDQGYVTKVSFKSNQIYVGGEQMSSAQTDYIYRTLTELALVAPPKPAATPEPPPQPEPLPLP